MLARVTPSRLAITAMMITILSPLGSAPSASASAPQSVPASKAVLTDTQDGVYELQSLQAVKWQAHRLVTCVYRLCPFM